METKNYVNVSGSVKASATAARIRAGLSAINFTLVVDGGEGERPTYVDCMAYGDDIVNGQLEGFVDEGEWLEVEGHLSFRTFTDSNGSRRSGIIVYVENVL